MGENKKKKERKSKGALTCSSIQPPSKKVSQIERGREKERGSRTGFTCQLPFPPLPRLGQQTHRQGRRKGERIQEGKKENAEAPH